MQIAGNTWVSDGDEYFSNYFKCADVFELDNLDLALSFVKKFNVAIDGGAHVGSWTRYLEDKFRLVAAFEPNKENFDCLCKNSQKSIKYNCGLSDHYGFASLAGGNNSGCWHLVEGNDVPLCKLPDFGGLDFLKLDIEGYEYDALKGCEDQLIRYKPIVLIEEKNLPHKPLDYAARNFLCALGYKELAKSGRDVIFGY